MKKIIVLLMLAFVVAMSLKAQPFAQASFGISVEKVSLIGELNIGYKIPFSECREYKTPFEGLMVSGGVISSIDAAEPAIFNFRAGKAFWLSYYSQIEIMAGYGLKYVSSDDKTKNSSGSIYSISYVNSFSENGSWLISLSKTGDFTAASIGFRFNFIKN